MGKIPQWSFLAAWIGLLCAGAAHAQFFSPPVSPFFLRLVKLPGERVDRFQVGAYWAKWELPSVDVSDTTLNRDAEAGLLLTADYFVTRNLSVGGWWNRITGDDRQTRRADLPNKVTDFEAQFWDVHATYYASAASAGGWSVQVGLSTLHSATTLVPSLGGLTVADTERSVNIWVARTWQLGAPDNEDARRPVVLFGSVGYIPSSGFGRKNVLVGGSVGLARHLDLSGTVWFNDLDDLNVRTTVGLVGSF